MSLTLSDRLEMIELVSRYNHAVDNRNAETWADTFTPDGVFCMVGGPEVRGRAALIKMVEDLPEPGPDPHRHWTTNFVIEGDAQHAEMRVDLAVLSGTSVLGTGRYVNELVRTDAGWRFTRRDYFAD